MNENYMGRKKHFGVFPPSSVSLFLQVPMIHWHLSTKRILTMEFAEGGQVNDRDYMKKQGINVNEVLLCLLSVRLG